MNDEAALRDKLRKIEALFAGAGTVCEKAAAGAAADRIRARLREEEKREKPVEMRFSLSDPWSRQMFIALCRRYGLRPNHPPAGRFRPDRLPGSPHAEIGVSEVPAVSPVHRIHHSGIRRVPQRRAGETRCALAPGRRREWVSGPAVQD